MNSETTNNEPTTRLYRFDVFMGAYDGENVTKVRSVGVAYHVDGKATYRIYLKTFLKDDFFLLPDQNSASKIHYSILTRVPSIHSGKKYFWHTVGTGKVLTGKSAGLMELKWDMLGANSIYMNLHPLDARDSMKVINEELPTPAGLNTG